MSTFYSCYNCGKDISEDSPVVIVDGEEEIVCDECAEKYAIDEWDL